MGACVSGEAAVSSKHERKLNPNQMRNLTVLYGHDSELFQAMGALQLLREESVKLVKVSDTFFKSLSVASHATSHFGSALEKLADKHLDAVSVLPPDEHTEELRKVLELDHLVKGLGRQETLTGELQTTEFATKVSPALHKLRDTMQKEYANSLEPLIDAHEAAFNASRGPKAKLEQLHKLPPEKKTLDANERSISALEVETAQQASQLGTTSDMLKKRVLRYVKDYTPKLEDAVLSFAVSQHDAYIAMGEAVAKATEDNAKLPDMRNILQSFLADTQSMTVSSPSGSPTSATVIAAADGTGA